jgi:hypothetical protein
MPIIKNLPAVVAATDLQLERGGSSARTLLPPRSNGKPEAATAVVVATDDGHEDARNMLSCT